MSTLAELHHPVTRPRTTTRRPVVTRHQAEQGSPGSARQSHLHLVQGVGTSTPREGALRLTRRGRLVLRVLSGVAVLAFVVAGVLLLHPIAEAGGQPSQVPVAYRVVLPGETLWEIAGEVAPGVDRRDTVADIVELNALPGAAVSAGQRIAVPSAR